MNLYRNARNPHRAFFLFINLLWFALFAYMTHITPVQSDDIVLTRVFGSEEPIRTVGDFFSSMWIHQMTWGGNLTGWGICQLFALLPRLAFELCNGLVWVGAANLLCRYACADRTRKNAETPLTLSLVYLAMWFFFPSLFQVLWLNAAIEYLWFNTLALLFCYLLFNGSPALTRLDLTARKRLACSAAWFLFGAFVSTCVKPSTGATLPALLVLGAVWAYLRKQPFDIPVFVSALLGVLFGFCLSLFSPGNAVRTALVARRSPYTASLLFRIIRTSYHGLRHSLVLLGITFFFVMLNRKRYPLRELDELFFVLLAFVNVAVMAIPNGYAPRTVLLSSMLLIIACARSAVRFSASCPYCRENRPALRQALWVLIAFLTAYALLQAATGVMMHFRNGTTFERETLYFLVDYDLF